MRSTARLTAAFRGRGKTLAYLGTAGALVGASTISAAAAVSSSPARPAAVASHAAAHQAAAHHAAAHRAAARPGAERVAAHASIADLPWTRLRVIVARRSGRGVRSGRLPLADRLKTGPVSGPQAFMPITAARMANATTIVHQDIARHMGIRSAVIAVATAMQESKLLNLDYGTSDSLGLFQQRPSMGWGTPAQVTDPAYAADAFLSALHRYQASDRAWARQPLWQAAQGVQGSAFPYAYAQWEDQAARVVASAARRIL